MTSLDAWMIGGIHIKGTTLGTGNYRTHNYLLIDLSAKLTFFFFSFTNIIIYNEKGLWLRIVQQGIYKLRDKSSLQGRIQDFHGGGGGGGRKRLCARTHIYTSAKLEVPFGSLVLSLILSILLRSGHKSIDQIFFFFLGGEGAPVVPPLDPPL